MLGTRLLGLLFIGEEPALLIQDDTVHSLLNRTVLRLLLVSVVVDFILDYLRQVGQNVRIID